MKVTILTVADNAGSGLKMLEAIRRYTDIDIEGYATRVAKCASLFGIKTLCPHSDLAALQRRLNVSDIIHIKGDWPPLEKYCKGLRIHQPIVITVSGNNFRKKIHGGKECWSRTLYRSAALRTSFECDLLYDDYGYTWTPYPMDSTATPRIWEWSSPIKLVHVPSNAYTKATAMISEVFTRLVSSNNCTSTIRSGVSQQEAIRLKQTATIYFDQFRVGFYGNSAVEAMQYGIPTACWISQESLKRVAENGRSLPIINTADNTIDSWEQILRNLLDKDILDKLSANTKEFCDNFHSYPAIAKMWKQHYYDVLSGKHIPEITFASHRVPRDIARRIAIINPRRSASLASLVHKVKTTQQPTVIPQPFKLENAKKDQILRRATTTTRKYDIITNRRRVYEFKARRTARKISHGVH